MKKLSSIVLGIFTVVFLAHCEGGVSSGKTVVSVNGKKITEGDLEFLASINPSIKSQLASPFGKKRLLDNLVEQELFYQASTKRGVQNDPKVQAKVDLYRKVIIAQALVENEIEKEAKKYYDAHTDEFQQLKMSQIMIAYATPEELKTAAALDKKNKKVTNTKHPEAEALAIANKIRDRLDKGEDFGTVAKQISEDPVSKGRGGDLGLVARKDERMERRGFAPLVEKAFEMKVGEIAGPIKTDKGYHIITVTAPSEQKLYPDAEQEIISKIRNDTRDNLLADLKKKAKVRYPEEKVAAAPATPAVPAQVAPSAPEGSGAPTPPTPEAASAPQTNPPAPPAPAAPEAPKQ